MTGVHYRSSDTISNIPVSVATPLPVAVISGGGALAPKGVKQLTVTTAALLSSVAGGIPAGASQAVIVPEGNAVRWADDGSTPTTSVGMPQAALQPYTFTNDLSALRFIAQSGTAILNIAFYG